MSDFGDAKATRSLKHKIETLLRDNSNQDTWIRSVRINARAIGASIFLLQKQKFNDLATVSVNFIALQTRPACQVPATTATVAASPDASVAHVG